MSILYILHLTKLMLLIKIFKKKILSIFNRNVSNTNIRKYKREFYIDLIVKSINVYFSL